MGDCQSHQCSHGGQGAPAALSADEKQLQAQLDNIKHKLLVMSGKGGVGKSSVATYLALGLAQRGYRVGLLDTDFHGPDTLRMLGLTEGFRADGNERLAPQKYSDNLGVVSIEGLLPDRDTAVIWRGPAKHGAIKQFVAEVNWGALDFLVIDSPPGTGDEPLTWPRPSPGPRPSSSPPPRKSPWPMCARPLISAGRCQCRSWGWWRT